MLAEDGRPEFVLSAPAVENLGGIAGVEAMHRAALNPSRRTAAAAMGGSAGKPSRNLIIIDDGSSRRAQEINELIAHPAYETNFVRMARRHRAEFGVPT
jgi:hypothetical protein